MGATVWVVAALWRAMAQGSMANGLKDDRY
jgi:hypothetical protein